MSNQSSFGCLTIIGDRDGKHLVRCNVCFCELKLPKTSERLTAAGARNSCPKCKKYAPTHWGREHYLMTAKKRVSRDSKRSYLQVKKPIFHEVAGYGEEDDWFEEPTQ